jgi:Fic family protein
MFDQIGAFDIEDLLKIYGIMMKDLLPDAGSFKRGGVGLFKDAEVVHVAPPYQNVSWLMADLFTYLKNVFDSLLTKSCVFHYEFEFMLSIVMQALEILESQIQLTTGNKFEDRLAYARNFLDNFKRKDYMNLIKTISPATASSDLTQGVKCGILESENGKNQTIYRFKK